MEAPSSHSKSAAIIGIGKQDSIRKDVFNFFTKQNPEDEQNASNMEISDHEEDYYRNINPNVQNAINIRKERETKTDFYNKLQTLNDRISVYKDMFLKRGPKILDFKYKMELQAPDNLGLKKIKSLKMRVGKKSHSRTVLNQGSQFGHLLNQYNKSRLKGSEVIYESHIEEPKSGGIRGRRKTIRMTVNSPPPLEPLGKRSTSMTSPAVKKLGPDSSQQEEILKQDSLAQSPPVKGVAPEFNPDHNSSADKDMSSFQNNPKFGQIESIKEEAKLEEGANTPKKKDPNPDKDHKKLPSIKKTRNRKAKLEEKSKAENTKMLEKIKNLEHRLHKIENQTKTGQRGKKSSRIFRKFHDSQKRLTGNKTTGSKNLTLNQKSPISNVDTTESHTTMNKRNQNNSLAFQTIQKAQRKNKNHYK